MVSLIVGIVICLGLVTLGVFWLSIYAEDKKEETQL